LTLNDIVTLKSGLEVTQGHSNRYHSKAWLWFYIHLLLYLASIPRYNEIFAENHDFFLPPFIRCPR